MAADGGNIRDEKGTTHHTKYLKFTTESGRHEMEARERDELEEKLVRRNYKSFIHIKILYGIIVLLLMLIIMIGWSLNEQIRTLKTHGLLTTDNRNYIHSVTKEYIGLLNKSALVDFRNIIFKEDDLRYRRSSSRRFTDYRQTHTKRSRHKRSKMNSQSQLHEYCMAIYDICGNHNAPGPPAMAMTRGPPGPPGPQGPKGQKGDEGPEGQAGSFGFDGIPGNPGVDGAPGQKGDRGLVGFPGSKGDKGAKGQMGSKGLKGNTGTEGPQGPPGISGPRGPPGPMGLEGLRGQNGLDGSPGQKGDKGNSGKKGDRGSKGQKGDDGNRGPPGYGINCVCEKGEKGDKGVRGLVGFAGYKGDKGDRGEKGERGYRGIGEGGPMGPPGRKGAKGQKGECQEWNKTMHNWRRVDTEKGGSNRFNEVPQQDYQARDTKNKKLNNGGGRDLRSSGTNLNNIAANYVMSSISWMSVIFTSFIYYL